ncbi:MAG: hypothetical protein KJ736_07915, partial [Candidatus Omnitrophica bacterium]|nr:hypothetical protein [Candidatus Omnitrophota bacterium]
QRVKKRESFRPYAPAVLEEKITEFFNAKQFSSFMLLSAEVNKDKKTIIPAVTHIDGSAKVQSVSKNINPRLWNLIKEFENITLIHYECFLYCRFDLLCKYEPTNSKCIDHIYTLALLICL